MRWLRFAIAGVALALACAPAGAQESEAAFTQRMVERFKAALPGKTIETGEPLQLLIGGEKEPIEINVGRIFNYCRSASAEECERSIADFVAKGAGTVRSAGAPLTGAQLRVAVRHRDYCDYIDSDPRFREKSKTGPLKRPFVGDTCILILADSPETARSVTAEDLEKIALSVDAAWATAERQTLADLPTPKALEGLDQGMTIVSDFDYAPSIMLNLAGWREAAAKGEILIAVPDARVAVVALSSKISDLAGLQRTVRENFDTAERGISALVYRWTKDGWVPVE